MAWTMMQVPVGSDYRLSGKAVKRAITRNTILVVASAPCFPHGVIDHIEDIAQVSSPNNFHNVSTESCAWLAALCQRCAAGWVPR